MDKQEFQQHSLWGEITARTTFWDTDVASISQPLQNARERARAVGGYVLALKSTGESVPALFSTTMLDNARTQWSQATVTYDTESNYPNMLNGLDALLDVVARWPGAKTAASNARTVTEIYAGAEKAASRAVDRRKVALNEAEQALARARSLSDEFEAKVAKIEATLADQQQRAGELATARQKEYLDELTSMKTEFDTWLDERKASYKDMTARRVEQQEGFIVSAE
ncbi:MAG: hypothetical protein WAW88_05080, partial [Nocardioides sp.]